MSWNNQDSGAQLEHEDNAAHQISDSAVDSGDHSGNTISKAELEEYQKAAREHGWVESTAIDYEALERKDADSHGWGALGARYEWKDDYGDVAPPYPELEQQLFGGEHRMRQGTHLEAFREFECDVQASKRVEPILSFEDAGLHPVMLENLKLCGYTQPTPIQSYCIPYGLTGNDMVAVAQTGSGKTAAYMIPVMSKLMGKATRLAAPKPDTGSEDYDPRIHKVRAEPLVVIVVPARELALQIFDEARRLCYRSRLRPCVTYGGLPYSNTIEDLGKGCDVLIATPGRLVDLMERPSILSMNRVKYTIIDEADNLLEDDWAEQLEKIMSGGDMNKDADHVFMLFSATFPRRAMDLAAEFLEPEYCKINVGRIGSTHRNIEQVVMWVDGDKKQQCLYDLLLSMKAERTLIFCNSKRTVDAVDDHLYNRGLPVTSITSDRQQHEREDSLRSFKRGSSPILVATGVSARGWDVYGIAHVINYDLPNVTYGGINEYVHRIGRTARIGHRGTATSFYNDRNEDIGPDLANLLLDSGAEVPEFLQQYIHEDGKAHFDDDEVDEEQAADTDTAGAAAWDAGHDDEHETAVSHDDNDHVELGTRLQGITV